MKTLRIYYAVMPLLLLAATVNAQVKTPDGRIEAHDVSVAYSGGKIVVSMQIDATRAAMHRTEAIVLTPVIRSEGRERELAPVVIGGHNRQKSDRRAVRFHRVPSYGQAAVAARPAIFPYNASTAYEPWMMGATLVLKEQVCGCSGRHFYDTSVPLMALRPAEPVKPTAQPAVTYITPAAEAVKNRNMSGTAFLDFPVGKSVILSDFRNNARELGKIRSLLDDLRNDKVVNTDSILLRGYASPDGSYATNQRLSGQRAQALRNYLEQQYSYPGTLFRVSSVAEDWAGLKTLVEESDLAGRDAILAVIDGNDALDVKERKLKALPDYQELLKNYFPQLRRVEYQLNYTVRAFSVEEGKTKVRTNPGQMSLNEMFLVANAYPKGSAEFNQVIDVAVRMFPSDQVANLNEGAMLLERGDAVSARRYLEPYSSDPRAANNLGVLYMISGDYARARPLLERAQSMGVSEAASNLSLLAQWEQYDKDKKAYDAYAK